MLRTIARARTVVALCGALGGVVGGAAGCAIPQSRECAEYVRCQTLVDDGVQVADYEPEGGCWRNVSTASRCTAQCRDALNALRELPDRSQCGQENG